MITVDELMNEYDVANDKSDLLKNHIINKYVNYEDKVSECKKIVELTMYKTIEDKRVFSVSSTTQHYLYNTRLIARYTDIELNPDNMLADYNKLNENGILLHLYSLLPEAEMAEFRMILQMCIDDEYENYRSMTSFLETKFEVFEILLNSFVKELDHIQENP